jgi:hypothetical protein
MKKTKIIAILSALVILTAMTGIAAADPSTVDISPAPTIIVVPDGTTETTATVTVTDIDDQSWTPPYDRYISVVTDDTKLHAKITGHTVDTGYTTTTRQGGTWSFTGSSMEPVIFTLTLKADPGFEIGHVSVSDNQGTSYSSDAAGSDQDTVTRLVLVPEFATIAIPAVGILGLFLFFNHRKRKGE